MGQCKSFHFASGKGIDHPIHIGQIHLTVHFLNPALYIPSICSLYQIQRALHSIAVAALFKHFFVLTQCVQTGMFAIVQHLAHCKPFFKVGLLLQVAQLYPITKDHFARIRCRWIHQRSHERCFSCAIFSNDSNFFTFMNAEGDVFVQSFDAIRLTDLMNGKQVFYIQGVKIILVVMKQSKLPLLRFVRFRPKPSGPLVGSRANSQGPVL
ncbi:MAG: Uncharacterised protein [Flavobacteriales bacterium UBA4585]|nr:MAG: Uncharacterised protein [Flavobacteriales bacterium UBA4585]